MRQLTLSKNQYIEKVLRDGQGRLVRATFCVYENGGRVKARLVDVAYIDSISGVSENYNLCGCTAENIFSGEVKNARKILSPFVSFDLLYSFGSKPRAPTPFEY